MSDASDDERRFGHWERIRQRGAAGFILRYGLLWTALLFAVTSVIRLVWGLFSGGDPLDFARDPANLMTGLAMFAAVGLGWAAIVWFSSERAYRKHIESRRTDGVED